MRRLFVLALLSTLTGCASAPKTPVREAPPPETTAGVAPKPVTENSKKALRREGVRAAVKKGLGEFLQHVTLAEEPVMRSGAFVGFRIAALDPALKSDSGPAVGDVVTKVNGFALEHPEDALTAFKSLEVASELVIAYERNGQSREYRIPIAD